MSFASFLTPRVAWSPPDAQRDRPVLGAIIGARGSLVVDTGTSPAHASQFRRGLIDLGTAAPAYAALTHWHWDHVFGGSALNVPTFAHEETRQKVAELSRLDWRDNALNARVASGQEIAFSAAHIKLEMTSAERGALAIPAPDIVFSSGIEVDLGDLTARIFHIGGDHTSDSSVVYTPEERVAFLGDGFYAGFAEGGAKRVYTTARLLPLLDRLTALDAEYYVLAHEPQPWPREEFLREAGNLRRTGELIDKIGLDREALLAQLPAVIEGPLQDFHVEDLDAFLYGMGSAAA